MRKLLKLFVMVLALVAIVATGTKVGISDVAHADSLEVRWDLVTIDTPFPELNPGGSASAKAEDGSKITLTGSGTFEVDEESDDEVTGGGTWKTFAPGDGVVAGMGTYEVTELISWDEAAGTLPGILVDNIGDAADARAGLVYLSIEYSDGSQGVLVVSCRLGGGPGPASPPEIMEGITASKGTVIFWDRQAAVPVPSDNLTVFHIVPDDDDDDDDD